MSILAARDGADFVFTNHGSLWLVKPTHDAAKQHLEENVGDEAQWFAGALAVEPRYVESLAAQLADNGWLTEGGR